MYYLMIVRPYDWDVDDCLMDDCLLTGLLRLPALHKIVLDCSVLCSVLKCKTIKNWHRRSTHPCCRNEPGNCTWTLSHQHLSSFNFKQACKPRRYASSKLRPSEWLTDQPGQWSVTAPLVTDQALVKLNTEQMGTDWTVNSFILGSSVPRPRVVGGQRGKLGFVQEGVPNDLWDVQIVPYYGTDPRHHHLTQVGWRRVWSAQAVACQSGGPALCRGQRSVHEGAPPGPEAPTTILLFWRK